MATTTTGRWSLALLLLRWVPGLVFLSEGIQKFLFSDLGTGRFTKLGFSNPAFWAAVTGGFEIVCGLSLIVGVLTRLATIPLLIIMGVAFATTNCLCRLVTPAGAADAKIETLLRLSGWRECRVGGHHPRRVYRLRAGDDNQLAGHHDCRSERDSGVRFPKVNNAWVILGGAMLGYLLTRS